MNRLADATSPYLLQHKDNPVDWWPWGDAAFAEAERRDRPVLISVGYAACHWCHVMAHESFEDEATAAYLNEHFVAIKVDREEQPDVDAAYMEATQALTGHGGWPMTVFATPSGEPFFCGTYFPPTPRHGMPSFPQLLGSVAQAWAERRDEVVATGQRIVGALAEQARVPAVGDAPTADQLASAVAALGQQYDDARGGFGGAPKFPPSMVLEFLLRHHARTGSAEALRMVEGTCEAMARGGMYDQLAGGFARYSVDDAWVVPHFEKMLYDNALLARVYLHWWRATGDPLARRVALETCDWLVADLRTDEGGISSSLDADTEGVEGSTYVWTPDQLVDVLGLDDGTWAAALLTVTAAGTFEHGSSTLQLPADPDDSHRWSDVRARLAAHRATRAQPARDDKVVAAWNGLAIAALAESGALLDRPDLVDAAVAVARLLVDTHVVDGRLRRASRNRAVGPHVGVLEDYGDLAEGLLTLFAVTGDAAWLGHAGALLDVVLVHFADGHGGFFDTADDETDLRLARRPQDPTDGATPSGWSAAAGALLTYAAYTGSAAHREAAERGLGVYAPLAGAHARFAGWGLAVAEALLDGPREVAVVGEADDPARARLHSVALRATAPGAAIAVGSPAAIPSRQVAASSYRCSSIAPRRREAGGLRLPPLHLRRPGHRSRGAGRGPRLTRMTYELQPLTAEQGEAMAQWRYPGPWAVYDVTGPLDPAEGFWSVLDEGGEVAGYACFGLEARVPGLAERPGCSTSASGCARSSPGRAGGGPSPRRCWPTVTPCRGSAGCGQWCRSGTSGAGGCSPVSASWRRAPMMWATCTTWCTSGTRRPFPRPHGRALPATRVRHERTDQRTLG